MIFCVLILFFCLEPMVREQVDQNDFRHYGIFLKVSFRNYLITAMFKVLLQILGRTFATDLKRRLTVEDFTDMDQHRH